MSSRKWLTGVGSEMFDDEIRSYKQPAVFWRSVLAGRKIKSIESILQYQSNAQSIPLDFTFVTQY